MPSPHVRTFRLIKNTERKPVEAALLTSVLETIRLGTVLKNAWAPHGVFVGEIADDHQGVCATVAFPNCHITVRRPFFPSDSPSMGEHQVWQFNPNWTEVGAWIEMVNALASRGIEGLLSFRYAEDKGGFFICQVGETPEARVVEELDLFGQS